MSNPENTLAAAVAVALVLQDLTDAEITQLHLGVTWQDGKSRKHCERKPWFKKAESLFTEMGGQEIHETVREEIWRVVNLRLTKLTK